MNLVKKYNHFKLFYIWLIFFILSLVVYGQILGDFFVSDDFHWLSIARDTSFNWHIFFSNYEGGHQGGSYNPLLVILFKFFYLFFESHSFGYHFISILLHSINAVLVYVLSRQIFVLSKVDKFKQWSKLSAILFLLYPVHVEAISWVAAWPHLWVTFFYLAALVAYFSFREKKSKTYLLYSLLFFILALLTKEIAISLPVLILLWEMYFYSCKEKSNIKKYYSWIYLLILAGFLWLRYASIGIIFGYYAKDSIQFSLTKTVANILPFFGDWLSLGFLRDVLYRGIYQYADLVAIVIMVFLALYFLILLKKKKYQHFVMIALLFLALTPVLLIGLHRTTFSGERYLYLPSAFFVMWLLVFLQDIKINLNKFKYIFLAIIILFLSVNFYKINIWDKASILSSQIVSSYQKLDLNKGQKLFSVALPDNLQGAEVFRNNLQQALEIYYPDTYPEIIPVYAYLQLSIDNKDSQILKWRQDDRGWFGESVDGGFVVTGITSISQEGMYWELWNYNYQNYLANIIRLIPNFYTMEKIKSGEIQILIFDQGKLRILK